MKTQLKSAILGVTILFCSVTVHASETLNSALETSKKIILHQDKGSTDPIKLSSKGIKNLEDLENAQYAYIDKHYENYELIGGYTLKQDNAFIRCVLIKKDGKIIATEFDVTECFNKLKSKNKAIKAELDELEKRLDEEKIKAQITEN